MSDDLTAAAIGLIDAAAQNPDLVQALAQPGCEKAGKAIGDLVDLVSWPTARLAIFTRHNLKRYQAKLDAIDDDKIRKPVPEIAVPLIERLGYVTDVNLAECLAALLAQASDANKDGQVHPSFVRIVDCLVPDEVILLRRLAWNLIFSDVNLAGLVPNMTHRHAEFVVADEVGAGLAFKEQLPVYLENLAGMGIIRIQRSVTVRDDLLARHAHVDEEIRNQIRARPGIAHAQVLIAHGCVELTQLGTLFMRACDLMPTDPPQ